MNITHHHIQIGWKYFWKAIRNLIKNPVFLMITILGNSLLLLAAATFYHFESGINPAVTRFFDAIWWATVTVTTVGYGDIYPVTVGGRLTAMALMLSGTVMFMGTIALFAAFFVQLELRQLEQEVESLRRGLKDLKDRQS